MSAIQYDHDLMPEPDRRKAASIERRARELSDLSEMLRSEADVPEEARRFLDSVGNLSAFAIIAAHLGRLLEAYGWLAGAERQMRHADRALLQPIVLRAIPFMDAQIGRRVDALTRLAEEAVKANPGASAFQLLCDAQAIDDGKIVQEIDDDRTIYWLSKGREKKAVFKKWENRCTAARKKISQG